MEPITLYVVEDGEQTFVFRELNEELKNVFGEAIQERTIVLKSPLTERLRQDAERLMWAPDPMAGMRKDEVLREAAYTIAFVESWTLPVPVSLEGYGRLAAPLARAVFDEVQARVFPNPLTSSFFLRYAARPSPS